MITTADIPPGGEGEIKVTLNTAHKKGQLEKTIAVESNDPNHATAQLRIKAFAEMNFGFESYSLMLGSLLKGDSLTKTAVLIIKDTATIRIADLKTSSEFVRARALDSITESEGSFKVPIEVTILPGIPAGQLRESVTATSSLPNKLGSNLRLIGNVIGDVIAEPETIGFNIYNPSDSIKDQLVQHIAVYCRNAEHPLTIEHIQDSNNRTDIKLDTVAIGKKYDIEVTLKQDIIVMGGNYSGYIIIATDNSDQRELRVRYQVANRNKK